MRLSVRKNDPGYNPRLARKAHVFLNGESMDTSKVFCVDEELGEVHVHETDENGKLIIIGEPMHQELKTKILKGKVKITFNN